MIFQLIYIIIAIKTILLHPGGSEFDSELEHDKMANTRFSHEFNSQHITGQKGLGFTIATREYTTCPGYSPLFVKTVHRHGAAAADGRMKPNDVLLKVGILFTH